jgi:thioredoxin reductase
MPVKSVAVVGCGPAGAITINALVQEGAFDKITVFERRERPGGCWIQDQPGTVHQLPIRALSTRSADQPITAPKEFPTWTARSTAYRFAETSIYPFLETNIAAQAMEFSQEPIPDIKTDLSVQRHGKDTPFRHHSVIQEYIEGLADPFESLIRYNTTVERIEKVGTKWQVVLREGDSLRDYWSIENFDAVIIASGHYTVPFIPHIDGLAEFAERDPGSVEHTKSFRDPEKYRGKRVVAVGASISGPDTAAALAGAVESPLHAVARGKYHPYFGDWAFRNPHICRHPPISGITGRTVVFEDGTQICEVDHIILGTGYSWTMPFLPQMEIRNNRVPGLYMHVFNRADPSMAFVGAVAAGFTFKVFEWQAVLAARFLAGRVDLPPHEEQDKWEQDRIALKGDGVALTALYPDFEEYFEEVRALAGEPQESNGGRRLPKFDPEWRQSFDAAHLKRIAMWQEMNRKAEEEIASKTDT